MNLVGLSNLQAIDSTIEYQVLFKIYYFVANSLETITKENPLKDQLYSWGISVLIALSPLILTFMLFPYQPHKH